MEEEQKQEQEHKKENANGDAPANGTEVCKGGDFPAGLELQLMVQAYGDSQEAHPLPFCCAGCALCLGL